MLAVRKLRFDTASTTGADPAWRDAVATLAEHLHSADGTRFVDSVDGLVARGEVLTEPWVGVVHGTPQDTQGSRSLGELKHDPTFTVSLRSCLGMWATSPEVKAEIEGWGLSVPVSWIRTAHTEATHEGSAAAEPTAPDSTPALVADLANSAIFRRLPIPQSQSGQFRSFDLTVFIISYKRLENIARLLSGICDQTYKGSFEVIIWNNNEEAADALEAIVAPFRDRLELTLMHSSRNYYCIVRLAMVHLMRGELLMICDDDVHPGPRYLEIFTQGLRDVGERAVVCGRGNRFRPHKLNWEAPEGVWERWDHLDFWDVDTPAVEIHFMHGSNCLIPKQALLELSKLDLPQRDFILVDDYWLSYALSGLLGWHIWEIPATDAFRFDRSAEDPEVALWLNRRVREERTNFYIYHMEHGWPEGCSA